MADTSSPAYIEVTDGPDVGRIHPITADLVLGRIPSCNVVLTDPASSRQHARVSHTAEGYFIEDLQSANGTYINDERITRVELKEGDRIRICRLEFAYHLGSGATAAPQLEPVQDTSPHTPPATAPFTGGEPPASGPYPLTGEIKLTGGKTEDVEQSVIHSMVDVADHNLAKNILSARTEEEVQRIYQRMEVINEVGAQISTILDLSELLESIMNRLFEVFPSAERGFILMVDPNRNKLVPEVIKRRDESDSSELQISKTIVRKSISEKQAILISDAAQDDRFEAAVSVMKFNIRSMMCVPLICQNEVLGIISIDTTRAGKKFKDDDLELLTAIASPIATALKNAQLVKEKEAEVAKRSSMERYFSPALVDRIAGGQISLDGERRQGVAFFSDIVGFTAMSNRLSAEQVVGLLNNYFGRMIDILFRHDATIDKFSGDAIMSVWGAPEDVENESWHATQAALEMQTALYQFNCEQAAAGEETIEMGIGLNYGSFIAGDMGASSSARKMVNYTIIGDDVNLAARIEARAGMGQALISETIYERAAEHLCAIRLPPIDAKGIPHPITIYSVRGADPIEQPGTGELLVCMPFLLSGVGDEERRSFFVRAKPEGEDAIIFDLVTPIDLAETKKIQCDFQLKEVPELPDTEAEVVELLPFENCDAIPQLAKVKISPVPEPLRELLTLGLGRPTISDWSQMVRESSVK